MNVFPVSSGWESFHCNSPWHSAQDRNIDVEILDFEILLRTKEDDEMHPKNESKNREEKEKGTES